MTEVPPNQPPSRIDEILERAEAALADVDALAKEGVDSDEADTKAGEAIAAVKAAARNLETARVDEGKFYLEAKRRIDARFKKEIARLTDRIGPLLQIVGDYRNRKAEAAAQAEREATAARLAAEEEAAKARRQEEERRREEERKKFEAAERERAARAAPVEPSPAPVAEPSPAPIEPPPPPPADAAAAEEALKAAKRAEAAAKAVKRSPTGLVSRATWKWLGDDFSAVIPYIMQKDPAALRLFAEKWLNGHVRSLGVANLQEPGIEDSIPGVKMTIERSAK